MHLRSADCEDGQQGLFLSPRKVQTPDDRHRENDDGEIRQDVDGRIGKPHRKLIDARRRFLGPESPHGHASKYATENRPDSVCDDDAHDGPRSDVELFHGEDASVLKKNSGFGQAQGEVVDNETGPEGFERYDHVFFAEFRAVQA